MLRILCYSCLFLLFKISHGQGLSSLQKVEISIVVLADDSVRIFDPCSGDNIVQVKLKNIGDTTVHFYETWNTWGYRTFSFEIETEDSLYTIIRANRLWWRNYSSFVEIAPNDSAIFKFELIDSTCEFSNAEFKYWKGLPVGVVSNATIKVIYHPQKIQLSEVLVSSRRNYRDTTVGFTSFLGKTVYDTVDNNSRENGAKLNFYGKRIESQPIPIRIQTQ